MTLRWGLETKRFFRAFFWVALAVLAKQIVDGTKGFIGGTDDGSSI